MVIRLFVHCLTPRSLLSLPTLPMTLTSSYFGLLVSAHDEAPRPYSCNFSMETWREVIVSCRHSNLLVKGRKARIYILQIIINRVKHFVVVDIKKIFL